MRPIRTYSVAATLVLLGLLSGAGTANAQCDPTVPEFTVDLSNAPNATWMSPSFQRVGLCCGATSPDKCLKFVITLHANAQGINFDICEGAVPPGALFYQIGCGPPIQVGQPICLNGPGPHILTFCKPGNNQNRYCITSIPAPSAGPDITINDGCTGTITSTGFAVGSVLWSSVYPGTPGQYDSYLSCPSCTNTPVVGQTGAPPYVDYRICGNGIIPCSSTTFCDTVRVYINPALLANITPSQPVLCYGQAGLDLFVNASGGTPPYSYLWSTGATGTSVFVGPGNYNVQVSDGTNCPATVATVVVNQFQQPITADTGPDMLVCGEVAPVQLNGIVTGVTTGVWSGGSGTYSPSNTALNATYTPTAAEVAAGSVQLTLTTTGNGPCPADASILQIVFDDPFTQTAITAVNATCATNNNGTVSVVSPQPGWTYTWTNAGAQNGPTASGLGAGNYSVTVTAPSGCDTTMSATLTAPAAISIASMQSTDETCAGNTNGSVTVTAAGGTPPYSYTWNNAATTPSITVGAGTWTVQVSDANGCAPATGSATVVALGQPNAANAGPDLVGCLGSQIPLNGSVVNATGGVWSGGNGTISGSGLNVNYQPSMAEILAGSATLTLTTTGNTSCPPASDVVNIALSNSFLNVSVSGTSVLCNGGNTGSASFQPVSPGLSYAWNDPAMQSGPNAGGLYAGVYQVQVTDALGCDTVMNVAIPQPLPLLATISASSGPQCVNTQNGSATVSVSGGVPGYQYQWGPSANNQSTPTAIGLTGGTHFVSITDANGCTTQASASLTTPTPVTLTAQVPDTVCINTPVLLSAQPGGGQGGHVVTWAGIGTGASITHSFPANQNVTVSVVDGAGCPGPVLTFPVAILDLSQATLSTYGDTTVCPGGSALVGAQLTGYPGSYVINWPTLGLSGSGPFNVAVGSNMTHPITVTDACGSTLNGQVVLGLEIPPTIQLPPVIAQGCAPLPVTFPDLQLGGNLSYTWNLGNGLTSNVAIPSFTYPAGQYSVSLTVSTPLGCTASSGTPGMVIVHPRPTAAFTASPWITDIDSPTIEFTDESVGSIVAHSWSFGDGSSSNVISPVHGYSDVGTFPVELWIQDINGCVDTVTRIVVVNPIYDIEVPNIFTPNANNGSGGGWMPGDLSNDVFYPFLRFVDKFRMRIFNRWGELIFESEDPNIGWDGWYRGQLSPQDVYVYQIWVRFVDGKESRKLGDLTLLR